VEQDLRPDEPRAAELEPRTVLLPALDRAALTQAQSDRRLAALQCIEAVRAYATAHDGRPPQRLDLLTAAAGEGAVQMLFLPTTDSRRVFEEIMPQLPASIGGGPVTLLTHGIRWAALSIDLPPRMAIRLTIQSQDAKAAEHLANYLPKLMRALLDAALKSAQFSSDSERPDLEPLVHAFTPTRNGDRLALSLDDRQINGLLKDILRPVFARARESARRMVAADRMRQIALTIFIYEKASNRLPPDLDAVVKAGLTDKSLLVNPPRPQLPVGYVYVMPKTKTGKRVEIRPDTLILYEAHDAWGDGVNVAFADGHVEFIRDEARFKRLLAAAQGQPTTRP
jgi:prepilin-type processing-associated H-X9-DG protein